MTGGASATYAVNALGQRVRKTTGGIATYFLYDEAGRLVGEYEGDGDMIQEIVWLGDTPIASLRWSSCGLAAFYIHTDHLNTPRRITRRSTPDIVWRWDSDPFGTTEANEDPDGDGTAFLFNLRFPGQYYDAETGLNYNYFRDYDAQTGRYAQSDPIGLGGGLNTYTYVNGNPTGLSDSHGLWATAAIGVGVRMVGGRAAGVAIGEGARRMLGRTAGGIAVCVLAGICDIAEEEARGLPPEGIKPPVPGGGECEVGEPSRDRERRAGGKSLWDPNGGEWRWHPGNRHHNPHWDYNPHDRPQAPWENIPHGDLPPIKPIPDSK